MAAASSTRPQEANKAAAAAAEEGDVHAWSWFGGRYDKMRTLGKGNFGKVYLARARHTGKQVAVKVVDKTSFRSSDQRQHALNEQAICERFAGRLRHKNIVDVYQVFANERTMHVAMEYVEGGELFEKIKQRHRLDESLARRWFHEIIEAVEYIHRHGIVHRDLKPENVLIDRKHSIRLCDFGFGKFCERQQVLSTYCGSPFYAAPEMITATPYHGPPVDMWSCGVILYAMLAGTLPFQGQDMPQLFRRINSVVYTMPRHISPEAANLIERLLCKNPALRMTAHDCLRHPWLKRKKLAPLPPPAPRLDPLRRAPRAAATKAPSSSEKKPSAIVSAAMPQRFWTRWLFPRHKTQIAPAAHKERFSAGAPGSKAQSMEGKVVHQVKGLFKSAFQRRLT